MDFQSLSAYVETQRLIASGSLSGDEAMHLIAECTRKVADATGVAVGTLKNGRLLYRAGSGSASEYAGRHLTAALNVSVGPGTVREILRVEDADNDGRIGAAVCKQFAARSLVMFVVQHDEQTLGVLQILFAEPHAFEDRELRTYQLMACLINETLAKAVPAQTPAIPIAYPVTSTQAAIPQVQTTSQIRPQTLPNEPTPALSAREEKPAYRKWTVPVALCEALLKFRESVRLKAASLDFDSLRANGGSWALGTLGTVTLTAIALWAGYGHRQSALPHASSTVETSNSAETAETSLPINSIKSDGGKEQQPPADARAQRILGPAFKRVRIGDREVDYLADDVTVRYFASPSQSPHPHRKYREVNMGNDVTIRYFGFTPASLAGSGSLAVPPTENR